MPNAFLLVCLCASAIEAISFRYVNTPMEPYRTYGYRMYPHFRVGIFASDSPTAKFAFSRHQPYVSVDLTVEHAPRGFAEMYVYRADAVEQILLANVPDAHPCMNIDQANGVALFPNMTISGAEEAATVRSSATRTPNTVRIQGSVPVHHTGLYIIALDACSFIWVPSDGRGISHETRPPTGNYVRVLDDNRTWALARVTGQITVRNPFGYMPGQAYGLIPCYSVFFVISFILTTLLIVGF